MTEIEPELWVKIVDDEILVGLPRSTYTAIYIERPNLPHLTLKFVSENNDPQALMGLAQFLGQAWKVANARARDLGWII